MGTYLQAAGTLCHSAKILPRPVRLVNPFGFDLANEDVPGNPVLAPAPAIHCVCDWRAYPRGRYLNKLEPYPNLYRAVVRGGSRVEL